MQQATSLTLMCCLLRVRNVYDILRRDKLVLTKAAIEKLEERLSNDIAQTCTKHYDVILAPVVTEKSTMGAENNQVTFRVAVDSSKPEIKAAVEAIFDVKVKAVNTLRQEGKVKAFPRCNRPSVLNTKKRSLHLLKASIDVTTGV